MTSLLVTVGSTYFDALIARVLAEDFLLACAEQSVGRLVVQYGKGAKPRDVDALRKAAPGVDLELVPFISDFDAAVSGADIVISHAGSGSILAALRTGKKLIVVPNETLMDNHQAQLADALGGEGYLVVSRPETLADTLRGLPSKQLKPFPAFDPSRFADLMDETMGYSGGVDAGAAARA